MFGLLLNPFTFTECSVSWEISIMVAQPSIQVIASYKQKIPKNLHFFKMSFFYIFLAAGFGIPGLVVGLTMGVSGSTYRHSAFCWLSYNNSSVWGMLGPEVICAVVHMVTMLLNLRTVFRYHKSDLYLFITSTLIYLHYVFDR